MRRRGLLAGAAVLALAGCASPPARYYRLAAVPGAVHGGTGARVGVRNVGLPGYLDQTNLPKPGGAYELDSFPNDLWAGSLAPMLQAAMVQDLAQRLPADTVLADGGAIGAAPDVLVEIQIFHFEPDNAGTVTLTAQLATRPAASQDWRMQTFTASAPGGTTPLGIVAVMSTLWGQAADVVAGLV
ncbi:MAG: PqiC family protein [Acidocella sp.]|nr:PqiC family protein [Acidocella sp.]